MPRAVGIFREFEWSVLPFPVDYYTYKPKGIIQPGFLINKMKRFSMGAREWIGLLFYRLMGYSQNFFPSPL